MSENPYALASGDEPTELSLTDQPLHPLSGVVVATLFGSIVAGAIVIAISLCRLGRARTGWWTIGGSLLVLIPLVALMFVLPDDVNIPTSVFAVPQMFGIYHLGKHLYGKDLDLHRQANGPIASAWKGAGIGFLCSIVLIIALVGAVFVSGGLDEEYIEFGDDIVYYEGDATRQDAQQLGETLQELSFLEGDGGSVDIRKGNSGVTISFYVMDDAWDDSDVVSFYRTLGEQLQSKGFGPPLVIELCDAYSVAHKSLEIE